MRALPLGLPFQGRWLGAAETERLSRICDNLSVCFADSSPARGAFGVHPVGAGLGSARCSDETSTHGRSRAPPLQTAKQIKKASPQKGAV